MKFLTQKEARDIDIELMGPKQGFVVEQLMELAGLSVAHAVAKCFDLKKYPKILTVAGPGNNGGDGLVAARHLRHFGYSPTICYPKPTNKPLYQNLLLQCKQLHIPILDSLPNNIDDQYSIILDAIFGFSFVGQVRKPFDEILNRLNKCTIPIVSVDIPSGWDVEKGNISGEGLKDPEVLVSLTAPKLCAKHFKKRHFLGGRFVPPDLAEKYKLELPEYPGTECVVEIKSL